MLKRITLWIVILIFPTSLWFAFTDDGNQAFQIWFGHSAGNLQPGPAEVIELTPTPPDQPEITYVPVQPPEAKVNKEWQGLSVITRDSSVILKVMPDLKSHQKYQYNQTRTLLQAFTASVVPHIVGIAADGPDGGLHPVGIMGSNEFTNRNGIKGLQTYVIHEVHSFSGEDSLSDISYEARARCM